MFKSLLVVPAGACIVNNPDVVVVPMPIVLLGKTAKIELADDEATLNIKLDEPEVP